MKYLNFCIILLTVLSACVFSEKPKTEYLAENNEGNSEELKILGDSITVDTVIGDFRLFYKVYEIKGEMQEKKNKEILLNIQQLDTTNIVSYKKLTTDDFMKDFKIADVKGFQIDTFYLKEVQADFVVFCAELYRVEERDRIEVDLLIDKTGAMSYSCPGKIEVE